MGSIRKARAVSGVLAVAVLLGLFVFEVATSATLNPDRVRILIILIAGLLGLDLLGENLPLDITVESGGSESGTESGSGNETPENNE